jgi:epoxyqueuosine reductase
VPAQAVEKPLDVVLEHPVIPQLDPQGHGGMRLQGPVDLSQGLGNRDIEEFQGQDIHEWSLRPLDLAASESFKQWLAQAALDQGFARVGFASCAPFHEERARLEGWFAQPGSALLPYLRPEAMLDPARVLPGAATALVGFFPYARPQAVPGAAEGSLKLSRYLWGPDYHQILKARLKALLAQAQERRPDLHGRVCVDTAPLLERQLAVRAGLGWQGKHTLLIAGKSRHVSGIPGGDTERGGSWGFLGVLLLDLALPLDPPFAQEHCGVCTRCLDACPTAALTPFRLDPGLCLTTYTVETEVEPPASVLRALAGTGWAAGCDRCQEVCPWNRIPLWGDPALWGGASPLHTQPAAQARMGVARWQTLTRGTALRRVRHRHWLSTLRRILGSF